MGKIKQKLNHRDNRIPANINIAPDRDKILALDLGLIPYSLAYNIQIKIFKEVELSGGAGVILLLEHYPIITTGSNGSLKNLRADKKELRKHNIQLEKTNRGGDITLHAPGQIVCYTILNLGILGKDLSLFVCNLEEVIIDVLKKSGIDASRINKHRGVFVNNYKIASIGLKVKRWITLHGFSLNVNNNLKYFDSIIACGLRDYKPGSIKNILKKSVNLNYVKEQIIESFSSIFNMPVEKINNYKKLS